MRNTIRVLLAAGVLIAGACGDDDDSGSADGGGDFCDRAEALYEDSASTDFSLESFVQLRERMAEMDPPAAIADDWQASIDAMNTLAEQADVEALDQSDPEVTAALEEITTSGSNIDAFVSEECDIDVTQ